ncbi:MAG: error-prone DNA polymerase [Hyphomicrobiaceae bacterium]
MTRNAKVNSVSDHNTCNYAELCVTTNFSFLRGGSHGEELVQQAKALGVEAIAVTDRNTLAGVVRAHVGAKEIGLKFIVGCRLDLLDGPSLLCFPTDRQAYGRLCRLLSLGQGRAEKGHCRLYLDDVLAHADGQIFITLPPEDWDWYSVGFEIAALAQSRYRKPSYVLPFKDGEKDLKRSSGGDMTKQTFATKLAHLRELFSATRSQVYLAANCLYRGDDQARLTALSELATACDTPIVAIGDVLYHRPERRALQDVLTCIREKCQITNAGFRLEANGERHIKSPAVMARLFQRYPEAIARTIEIATACRFSLDELVYEYPDEPVPEGKTPQGHLEDLAWSGAQARFPDGIDAKVKSALSKELKIIAKLDYAPYFLTVHDVVRFARSQNILCQGRGSAANSVVCYCLGITSVDPIEIDLLFERFISEERLEPPDIDVDFEHERREEVIQYVYARYGRHRAGIAATVISYRSRSAVRDVGKVMGLSEDTISALAGMVWGSHGRGVLPPKYVREAGLDPDDPLLSTVLNLTAELTGFPRHLSQHVGGFVLTRGPLVETVPVGNAAMAERTYIEWDKDDIAAIGLQKVDVLSLGMLTCIQKAFSLLQHHHDLKMTLAKVPRGDTATYDMLCRADSLGVFQVESRAQMNMLPRLRPREFYDLVIEVAIVRPGPIQGDMVHPYLRRRNGLEPECYPSPSPEHGPADELKSILGKTKGVPLFQEQAMRIAMEAAKFNDREVNELRKAMATFRRRGTIELLEEKMVSAMAARGYDREFAQRCFNQIKGFGEYGFPESHAASFALLAYVSSWLKCHYPAVFCCAILNSQPMGFYAPAQLVRDAREHGVEVRPVDVSFSDWDCTLEARERGCGPAVRLGLRQVDGLGQVEAEKIVSARNKLRSQSDGAVIANIANLKQATGASRAAFEKLAAADCFRSLDCDRRQALWQVKALPTELALPLFEWSNAPDAGAEVDVTLPQMALSQHVVNDYQTLRLSLKGHPLKFLRQRLSDRGVVSCEALRGMKDGARVSVAGVILVRQRPGSAKGVVFITLEDETGVANAVVWAKTLERYRREVMAARLILIHGRIQRHEDIIHVVSERLEDCTHLLALLMEQEMTLPDVKIPLARADEVVRPDPGSRSQNRQGSQVSVNSAHPSPTHPRNVRVIPKSRDFH